MDFPTGAQAGGDEHVHDSRPAVGTEFLPRIYSRHEKFPINHFRFSVTYKEDCLLHVSLATRASSWDPLALAFGGPQTRRKDRE